MGWGLERRGSAHVVQQWREAGPQFCAQKPHRRPRPQQEPPQRAQRGAHEPRIVFTQRTQESGQQRAHVPHLRRQGSWAAARTPVPSCPAQLLTFRRFSARWPRPSKPSQRTVGSGSPCQARSRSRITSSRRSRAVGQLCNS